MDVCSGCGLAIKGGDAACQALADQLWARDLSDALYFRSHRLMVDAYAVQHPDRYCDSAKSLAAHLGGLCCAFERRTDPSALDALQRWLSKNPTLMKPQLPEKRGVRTIAEVRGDLDPVAHARAVERWARSTWDAHEALHDMARGWVEEAMAARDAKRK